MAGWHHWLDGCKSEWAPGVGDGQGGLACCDSWGHKESDMTDRQNWTELNICLVEYPTLLQPYPETVRSHTPVLYPFTASACLAANRSYLYLQRLTQRQSQSSDELWLWSRKAQTPCREMGWAVKCNLYSRVSQGFIWRLELLKISSHHGFFFSALLLHSFTISPAGTSLVSHMHTSPWLRVCF